MLCSCGGQMRERKWIKRGKTRWDGTVTQAEECRSCGRVAIKTVMPTREFVKANRIRYPVFARGNEATELFSEDLGLVDGL